jgi:NAD(P)H dehydrogenase (quinone)
VDFGGGSPYGASSVSGQNSDRPPNKVDLDVARSLGKRVAETARKISQK